MLIICNINSCKNKSVAYVFHYILVHFTAYWVHHYVRYKKDVIQNTFEDDFRH